MLSTSPEPKYGDPINEMVSIKDKINRREGIPADLERFLELSAPYEKTKAKEASNTWFRGGH